MNHFGKILVGPRAFLFGIVLLCGVAEVVAAQTLGDWDIWKIRDSTNTARVDHGMWQSFLSRYLDTSSREGNLVRYRQVTDADKKALESYLTLLQGLKVSRLSGTEQKAYWINLYNSATVAVILRHYPVQSVRDIDLSPGALHKGPWDAIVLEVEGRKLSLNDIEHHILRPVWKDNLVHFGLNCASLGCPDLAPLAFTAENTDRLLEKGARNFINSHRGAYFEGSDLMLSSIFDWYRNDFGKNDKSVLAFLSRFAAPTLSQNLMGYTGKIRYQYDWRLNEVVNP